MAQLLSAYTTLGEDLVPEMGYSQPPMDAKDSVPLLAPLGTAFISINVYTGTNN